jgi:hypothetical protein
MVPQPGVQWLGQLGTATHGKSMSGSASNGVQKPLRVHKNHLIVPRKCAWKSASIPSDSSKPGLHGPCSGGHALKSRGGESRRVTLLILAVLGTLS